MLIYYRITQLPDNYYQHKKGIFIEWEEKGSLTYCFEARNEIPVRDSQESIWAISNLPVLLCNVHTNVHINRFLNMGSGIIWYSKL